MATVRNERGKEGYHVEKNVANSLNNSVRLLALVQRIAKLGVDSDDVVYVPEDLLEEVETAVLRNNVGFLQRRYPDL